LGAVAILPYSHFWVISTAALKANLLVFRDGIQLLHPSLSTLYSLPSTLCLYNLSMRFLIALLAIAGIVDSALALRIHYQDPNAAPPCAVTEKFDCGTVNHSRFAVFPPTSFDEDPSSKKIHVPVAALGIAGYLLIGILALANRPWLTLQAAEIGFGFAAFLTYMEAYILEKWCIYCLWSQAIIAAIVLCAIAWLFLNHRQRRAAVSP